MDYLRPPGTYIGYDRERSEMLYVSGRKPWRRRRLSDHYVRTTLGEWPWKWWFWDRANFYENDMFRTLRKGWAR